MSNSIKTKLENAQKLSSAIDNFMSYCKDMEIILCGDINGFISYDKLLTLLVENLEMCELAKEVEKLLK